MKLAAPFLIFLVLIVFGFFGYFWWKNALLAPSEEAQEVRFVINKGSSIETIGENLEKSGLIRNAFAFKIYLQSRGLSNRIPSGQFKIPTNLNTPELVNLLLEGPLEVWVTIPEGLRREQYPNFFIKSFELSPNDALSFSNDFLDLTKDNEGYLFPDTYLFSPEASAAQVVSVLTNNFNKKFKPSQGQLNSIGLTLNEVVTLASIIERETKTSKERPIVAGIYLNRIKAGWPLQADATIQYAIASFRCVDSIDICSWWETPLAKDKEFDSFYNTYKYKGLPPGPISNPGLTSLNAVINPQETDYWYYIHDKSGQVYFAKTLEAHNLNIQKYLK